MLGCGRMPEGFHVIEGWVAQSPLPLVPAIVITQSGQIHSKLAIISWFFPGAAFAISCACTCQAYAAFQPLSPSLALQ